MMYRFGSALILLGVIALTIFVITLSGEQSDYRFLLSGCLLCVLGLILHRRHAPAKVDSGRFQTMRHLFGRTPEEDE
jgi:hypothetical protein